MLIALEIVSASVGLYAGITNINFELYEPKEELYVVEEYVDKVETESIELTELDTLAKIIYSEAGSQGWDCMIATGSVILNRRDYGYSWQTGDSIMEVWSRSGQYSTYKNRDYIESSEEAYEAAEYLLINGSQLPSYVLYQSRSQVGEHVYTIIEGEVFSYD